MKCGDLIKDKRASLKLTREALAEKSGVSVMTIRRYESSEREPRLDIVEKLAVAMGCTIYDLLEDFSELDIEDQKEMFVSGDEKAKMNAMYDALDLEGRMKVGMYVNDLYRLHMYRIKDANSRQD